MRRREFIALLGRAAALSPFAAHAQQAERVRRVGILLTFSDEDAEAKAWLAAFRQGLERRGWREGRNLHIDIRSASARGERIPGLAKELVALQPDVLLAQSTAAARALQRETQTLPIVFVHVSDPIGAGIVTSLARPEANLTGVLHYEAGIVGKWLAMLKEMSPRLERCGACQQQDHGFRLFPMLRARRGVFARSRSGSQPDRKRRRYRALPRGIRTPAR